MMTMKMPMIIDCKMTECAYNTNKKCHAMAITVGGPAPLCDTFIKRGQKGGVQEMNGSVGACKVETCSFNNSLECTAEGIHVGVHADHAECDTFSPRMTK
jgi:hypothetical protein